MKKLLSLLLALLMLCSISAVTVSAEPFDKHVIGMNNGYEICVINPEPSLPRYTEEIIGDYYFMCGRVNHLVFRLVGSWQFMQ